MAILSLLPDVDARFERVQVDAGVPGVAWGVLRDGRLVHAGGAGTIRDAEDRRPDADTAFRIASMTKSFTAATVLLLRDEGRLRLDDPVSAHVSELAGWRAPTADAPSITLRDLLTMSAGLPTDDPWGDRLQGMALDRFAALLAAGPWLAWPPGTQFEYSNLGYGILGRVITNVAGAEYREVVRDRLLVPLGMTATTYLEEEVPAPTLAHGYVRRGDALIREGRDGYGALASMGGVFSTVRDLARWVAGFLDAFPARDDPEGRHPLRRASRREMQQAHRAFGPVVEAHDPDAGPVVEAGGYGFGLFVRRDPDLGTIVGHAGGYPGFGSHMAWHPATGLGVIALGNLRYAPMRPVAAEVLAMLVRADAVPRRLVTPRPATVALRPVVDRLVDRWDDGVADDVFAINMDLDEPREDRRAAVARILELAGGPLRADDEQRPPVSDSPADLAWWRRGERGWVRVWILATPESPPRIQALRVTAVMDPSPELRSLAARILALAAGSAPPLPEDLPLAAEADRPAIERTLRAAGTRFGAMALGLPTAGDGQLTATWGVVTERGNATLTLDRLEDGAIRAVRLQVAERAAPPEPW